jgi:RNA polymerase sigma-70 factor, ECF subfamily
VTGGSPRSRAVANSALWPDIAVEFGAVAKPCDRALFQSPVFDYAQRARSTGPDSQPRSIAPPSMAPIEDRELVASAKEGNLEAFGVLVRRHQRRIYRAALHLLRNASEAEDVAQDTFVRAYLALPRFDGRSQPYTWFYRIAINLSLNRLRSRKRRHSVTVDDDPRLESQLLENHPAHAPESYSADRQLGAGLVEALDSLSETLRTTLILVSMDGLSHAETATILGCPEGTVAWRVHEARKKIRVHLQARGLCDPEEQL